MLPKTAASPNSVLSQFVDRFQRDGEFRSLAQRDAHAALDSVGIAVPAGIRVRFADSAASAIGLMLDRPPAVADAVLEDALLTQVAGGVTQAPGTHDDLQAFLSLFHYRR